MAIKQDAEKAIYDSYMELETDPTPERRKKIQERMKQARKALNQLKNWWNKTSHQQNK